MGALEILFIIIIIGHNLSLICQLTSEDIKHHYLPTYSLVTLSLTITNGASAILPTVSVAATDRAAVSGEACQGHNADTSDSDGTGVV